MLQLTARQVRAYKGAAASILLLLLIERRPMGQDEMRRGTGYGDDVIHDAVLMLREDGLIIETGRYTWALLDGMQQLPIGAEEFTTEGTEDTEKIGNNENNGEELELGPTQSELALNESMNQGSTESIEDDSLIDSAPGPEKSELHCEAQVQVATAAWLQGLGFYGKGIADMLRIQGLTQDEVRWQVEHSPGLGCALARIRKRQGWGKSPGGDRRERDGPGGYVGGKYAEFIKH